MACTAAVETVVTNHIAAQLDVPRAESDVAAHGDAAVNEGKNGIFYDSLYWLVAASTEFVIWLGMKL